MIKVKTCLLQKLPTLYSHYFWKIFCPLSADSVLATLSRMKNHYYGRLILLIYTPYANWQEITRYPRWMYICCLYTCCFLPAAACCCCNLLLSNAYIYACRLPAALYILLWLPMGSTSIKFNPVQRIPPCSITVTKDKEPCDLYNLAGCRAAITDNLLLIVSSVEDIGMSTIHFQIKSFSPAYTIICTCR